MKDRLEPHFGPGTVAAQSDIDLVANRLEVTQAIQDLKNSIRLVANKRTFVRFHVSTRGGAARTTAALRVTAGDKELTLNPINTASEISVVENPDRLAKDSAFLFEIPDGFKAGTVTLRGELNPASPTRPRSPEEPSYDNNVIQTTATFEVVPTLNLVIYNLGYKVEGELYYAPDAHLPQMVDWIRRAWPVSEVKAVYRKDFAGNALPDCGDVNSFLASKRVWDLQSPTSGVTPSARYYGMVSDMGGFMRGCADGLPGFASSGPTGVPRDQDGFLGRWIPDISWGGFYGGHEVAHSLGRYHAEFCGAQAGEPFPNPDGSISPGPIGPDAIYGFDIETQAIYGPEWKDNMTYCPLQWNGQFTYHGIMDAIQKDIKPDAAKIIDIEREPQADGQDRLLVVGEIWTDTNTAELDPMFIIPNAREVKVQKEGPYAIVLRNAAGGELLRYRFKPDVMDEESTVTTDNVIPGAHGLGILELVPYVQGTTSVEVEGPNGAILITVRAGESFPTITVTSPNGGETFSGEDITVKWTATDPDGDPLYFDVQYSPDNGASWEMLDEFVTGDSVTINASDIVAGKKGLFRVWVSDGIHSASDTVDASFEVPNHIPTVKILSPSSGSTVQKGQTIGFRASAYDVDLGTLSRDQIEWSSDLGGVLGKGESLSIATLQEGTHTITCTARDADEGVATATVQLIVTATNASASTLRVAQVGGGSGFSTTITVQNLSGSSSANGAIYFFRADGGPLTTIVSQPIAPFVIAPSGTFRFSTSSQGALTSGYATVVAHTPIEVSVSYSSPGLGTAVTRTSPESAYGFRAAVVERNASSGADVGISVVNVGVSAVRVVVDLVDAAGRVLKQEKTLQAAPGQQLTALLSSLFPDITNFRGTLRIGTAGGAGLPSKTISATVVQFGAGQFFAVPVTVFTKAVTSGSDK